MTICYTTAWDTIAGFLEQMEQMQAESTIQTENSSAAQFRGREAASMQRSVGPNKPF